MRVTLLPMKRDAEFPGKPRLLGSNESLSGARETLTR